jgi:AraC family transcriptional regulator, positive regulator of tynA and feaB
MPTFSTADIAEKERLEFWQESVSRVLLGLRTERRTPGPFFGEFSHREAQHLSVTYLHSAPQRVYRGNPEIARAPRDCYIIAMQLAGVCTLRQGGGERHAQPGDVELLDATRPGELSFDTDYRRVVIAVPQQVLRPRLAGADDAVGSVVRSTEGVGALVSSYLRAFAENQLAEPVAGTASDILVDLLAMAFNAVADKRRIDSASVREARRHAVRTWVERNLSDPALSPARVAAHFRMSTRYLHGLFTEAGESFMRWVLSRRLARCRESLRDPAMAHRSIADLAFGWGFQDLSHFGRAFKAAFGMTPRDWRAEGRVRQRQDRRRLRLSG